jgi:rod shape-determining protein MreC
MRNLWVFFLRYYAFFLFFILEIIAFSFIARNKGYQSTAILNSANSISGNLYSGVSNAKFYLSLGAINDSLVSENARLRSLLLSEKYDPAKKTDSNLIQRYTYTEARVINNSVQKRNNYLTLDKGSLQGIKKDMAVICGNGIVGVVKDVSYHFSTVISFLHKDLPISAQINRTKDFGSLTWEGLNPKMAKLMYIPTDVMVKVGDTISTSGFSSIFPPNILVGTVTKIDQKSGESFYEIDVKLSTNFSKLRYVYIIKDRFAQEKIKLEEGAQND